MKSAIDFTTALNIWCEQTRWKGIFPVEWLLIKDVPNKFFQHLKIPANDYKPVTNSRDTQEIPFDIGISMLKIVSSFKSMTKSNEHRNHFDLIWCVNVLKILYY